MGFLQPNAFQPQCAARSIGVGNLAVTTLVQAMLTAFCDISSEKWPENYGDSYIYKGVETFDYIVVGAGTAGSVIAGRLSENPLHRVLLIEAGENPPVESEIPGYQPVLLRSKYDWNYQTVSNKKSCLGFPGGACPSSSGKMFSGSAGINAMTYILGNRRDFSIWEKLGNPNWNYDEVLKYYRKSENYLLSNPQNAHGTDGPLIVDRFQDNRQIRKMLTRGAREAGYKNVEDFRDGDYLGVGTMNALLTKGVRHSPAKAYLRSGRFNLVTIKNAVATKINFNEKNRAVSVSFVYKDKTNEMNELVAKCTKEIIISAGAIETPKLLMLSGVGPREHLESLGIPVVSNLPGVGQNLQDHIFTQLFYKTKLYEKQNLTDDMYNYLIHRTGNLLGVGLLDLVVFQDVGKTNGIYPNVQTIHYWLPKGSQPGYYASHPAWRQALGHATKYNAILGHCPTLLNPKSSGTVKLASANYRDSPIIYPNYLSNPYDVKVLIAAIKELLKFENTPSYQEYGIEHLKVDLPECRYKPYGSDAYWECYVRHTTNLINHHVGTAKMGPDSDRSAVVDSRLRVKGVSKLRVVDGSVMPTIVSANVQATIVAIAEKGADLISKDWPVRY